MYEISLQDLPAGLPVTSTDVLILGGGAAGLFAAVEAGEMGAEVLLLESEPAIGGSAALSGGYVSLCETPLVPQTRHDLLADLDEAHEHDACFELSRLYTEQSGDTFNRMAELGIEFVGTMQFAHMSAPWAHEPGGMGGGAEIVTKLERAAVKRGAKLQTSTRGQALIRSETGRVVGVTADRAGETRAYMARRAVVLATGGFTRNPDLIRRYGRPEAERLIPVTGSGSRGDGLMMGLAAGAATSYLERGIAPTVPVDLASRDCASLVNYKGAILVNRNGERFCDESQSYTQLSWAGLQQPEQLMVQIYDAPVRADYRAWQLAKILGYCQELSAPDLKGLAEALATAQGVNAPALLATLASYNETVAQGQDPAFGRRALVGDSGALRPIHEGPFYATILKPGTTHFNGGLKTNRNFQIVTPGGDVIPGVYAVGEVIGGFHGAGYMSGSFLGSALIFGRIAGRNAADERREWGEAEAGSLH